MIALPLHGEVEVGDPAAPLGVVGVSSFRGDRIQLHFAFPREIAIIRREIVPRAGSEGSAPKPA